MTDAITLHKAAISAIAGNVAGITRSFAIPPAKLDTADLPAFYVLTSGATNDTEIAGDGAVVKTRIYRAQVAGIPTGQADPETREGLLAPLLESVVDAFFAFPYLNATPGVIRQFPKSDSGIVILPEYGMSFVGFEVRIQVEYLVSRNFEKGE